jgi:hypothetical protein
LLWEMNTPFLDWEICNPRNNNNSPSMDISNYFCISCENVWLTLSSLLLNMIPSS